MSCGDKLTMSCGDKLTMSCGDKLTTSCGDKLTRWVPKTSKSALIKFGRDFHNFVQEMK